MKLILLNKYKWFKLLLKVNELLILINELSDGLLTLEASLFKVVKSNLLFKAKLFVINFWLVYFTDGARGIRLALVVSKAPTVEISVRK